LSRGEDISANNKWKLLIVDDDADQAKTMRRLLEKRFEAGADLAGDLAQARKELAGSKYDVVLLDYNLPDGDGLQLLSEITSREAHPEVILVTGAGAEEVAAEAFRLNAAGYVVKDSRLPLMLPQIVERSLNRAALRKAQEDLKQNEENLSALLNAAPETMMLIDLEAVILTINHTGAARLGRTPEEMIGTRLGEYMPRELSESRRRYMDGVIKNHEPARFEDKRADMVLSNVIYPVFDGAGKKVERLAIFSQDVTEQRMVQEALQRSREDLEERVLERTAQLQQVNTELRTEIEERKRIEQSLTALSARFQDQARVLDQILSASPRQFYLFDDKGKFVYVNRTAAELFGLEQSEMAGKYWWDLGFPESAMRTLDVHRENVMRNGEPWVGEVQFPTPRGLRDFEYVFSPMKRQDGTVDTVVASAGDITDQKKASADLSRYADRMREQAQLLDLTHETVMVRDMEGRIQFWNAGAEEMFGWKREEALGKDWRELLESEPLVPWDEVEEVLLGEGRWEGELVVKTRDGRRLNISSRQAVRWGDAGQPNAVLEIDYDITERKELELGLEERIAALEARAAVTDALPVPVIIRDMNGKVTLWSEQARKTFGWTREEALGMSHQELLGAIYERPLTDIEFDLLNEGSWRGDVTYRTRDGEEIKTEARWVLRMDEDGRPQSIIETLF
jgi:PAS domain S-box-containing protein